MGTVVGRGGATGDHPGAVLVAVARSDDPAGSEPGGASGSGRLVVRSSTPLDGTTSPGDALARAEEDGAVVVVLVAADHPDPGAAALDALAELGGAVVGSPDGGGPGAVTIDGLGLAVVGSRGRSAGPTASPPGPAGGRVGRWRAAIEGGSPGVDELTARLEGSSGSGRPHRVVLGLPALAAIGGLAEPLGRSGLDLVDVADRLVDGGWPLVGADERELPFTPGLTAHLDPVDRFEAEGRALRRRAVDVAGRLRLARHRRRVLAAVGRLDANDTSDAQARADAGSGVGSAAALADDLLEVADGARRSWQGARPDEAQRGVGRRADWRQLIGPVPAGPRGAVAILGLGPASSWHWLVDDGWAGSITVDLDLDLDLELAGAGAAELDTVVVGPAALDDDPDRGAEVVAAAARAVGDRGSVVVLAPRRLDPRAVTRHRRLVRALVDGGLTTVERFLALPDVEGAKRYVPLDHPGGPAWLVGPEPALAEARLPRRRRLLRQAVGRLAPVAPELLGGVVLVGSSTGAPERAPAVVLTSGFDEGSRTVALPLGPDGRPDRVMKITARPAYRDNAEREHRLLADLSARVRPEGLVPRPLDRIDDGRVHAVVESYGGRWTVTDALNEQGDLARRTALLTVALDAVTDLARTPPTGDAPVVETWNTDGFDGLIGRWFDQLDEAEGPAPARAALRAALAERSDALTGRPLPLGVRHFDLGPWNMVVADRADQRTGDGGDGRAADGVGGPAGRSLVTVVDWELAPPRQAPAGPVGADHLYVTKYWLHIAAGCHSVDDELSAFAFLADDPAAPASRAPDRPGTDTVESARRAARAELVRSARDLGLDTGFLPLLEAHLWAEAACYTRARRRGRGGDGGSPARYLDAVARNRTRLLDAWPVVPA